MRAGRFLAKAREDTRFCRTQLYGFSREVMGRLGSDLAAAGWLDSPDDYVHLEAEELLGAFDGTSTHADLRGLARARKDAYLQSCGRPALAANFTTAALPIDVADLRRRAATHRTTGGSSTELTGLPSSAGIARGRAKLVLRPDVPPSDCAGRILVARETDPGWLPLMLNASGLVVERGSMVSHTAITGRMLGIPTVVAVPGATSEISDGDEIEIDGRSGTVRIFHRHSTETAVTSCNYRSITVRARRCPRNHVDLFRKQPTLDVELADGTAAIAVTRQCDVRTVLSDNRFSRAQFRHAHVARAPIHLSHWSPRSADSHTVRRRAIQGWFTTRRAQQAGRSSNASPTNSSTTCSRQAHPPTSTRGSATRSRTSYI